MSEEIIVVCAVPSIDILSSFGFSPQSVQNSHLCASVCVCVCVCEPVIATKIFTNEKQQNIELLMSPYYNVCNILTRTVYHWCL